MAQFKFKLQPVLRQREIIEQQRQRDVAAAECGAGGDCGRVEADGADGGRCADRSSARNQLVGPLNLSYLAGHRRFMIAMQRQGVAVAQKLEAAQKKVDAERVKLAEASKQRRIIEKLREKQQAEWLEAANRKETAALDEVAMQMSTETMREQWQENRT